MISVAVRQTERISSAQSFSPEFIRQLYSAQPDQRTSAMQVVQELPELDKQRLIAQLTGNADLALRLYAQDERQAAAQACIETFFGSRQAFFDASPGLTKKLIKNRELYRNFGADKTAGLAAVISDIREQSELEFLLTEVKLSSSCSNNKAGSVFNYLCCSNSGLEILKCIFLRYKLHSWSPARLLSLEINPERKSYVILFDLILNPNWDSAGQNKPIKGEQNHSELLNFLISSFPDYNNATNLSASTARPRRSTVSSYALAAAAAGVVTSDKLPKEFIPQINFIRLWNHNIEIGKYPQSCKKLPVSAAEIHKIINSLQNATKYLKALKIEDTVINAAIEKNLVAHNGNIAVALQDNYLINAGQTIDMLTELADSVLLPAFILKYDLMSDSKAINHLISYQNPTRKILGGALHRRFKLTDINNFTHRYHLQHTQRPESICTPQTITWRPLFSEFSASNGVVVKCETSREMLREHSLCIGHCVGNGSGYSYSCATMEKGHRGLTHTIGFRDDAGQPISTIELKLAKADKAKAVTENSDFAFCINQWSGFGPQTFNKDPRNSNSKVATAVIHAWKEFLTSLARSELRLNISKLSDAETELGGYNQWMTRHGDSRTQIIQKVGYEPSEERLKQTILHWHMALAFSEKPLQERAAIYRSESRSTSFANDSREKVFVSPAIFEVNLCSPLFGSGRISRLSKPNGPTVSSNFAGYSENDINEMNVFALVEQLLGMSLDEAYEQIF